MRRARVKKPLRRLNKKRRNHNEEPDELDFDACAEHVDGAPKQSTGTGS